MFHTQSDACVRTLLILTFGLIASNGAQATTTPITDPGAGNGNERCLTSGSAAGGTCAAEGPYSGLESMIQLFADEMGMTLTRVDDSSDQVWTAGAGSGIFGFSRSAGRDFDLGVIAGSSGNLSNYDDLLAPIGSSTENTVEYLPTIPSGQNANNDLQTSSTLYKANSGSGPAHLPVFQALPANYQNGSDFRFAIQEDDGSQTPDLWSSNPADNRDGHDHMVTWELNSPYLTANNLVWYISGFENAAFPASDGDFNDYVFVFQNVTPVAATPEPTSPWLVGLGGCLLLVFRRRGHGDGVSEPCDKW